MSNDAPGDSAGRKRRTVPFRQHDVTRALRAARDAGLVVSGYQIDATGQITVTIGTAETPAPDSALDRWLAKHGHAKQRPAR